MSEQPRLDPIALGKRVVNLRSRLHLEQSDVAEKSGLSRSYISRLENGLVGNPKIYDLEQIAQAVDVPLPDLVRVEPEVVETHYSADFTELQRQISHYPLKKQQRIIRSFWASVEIAQEEDDD